MVHRDHSFGQGCPFVKMLPRGEPSISFETKLVLLTGTGYSGELALYHFFHAHLSASSLRFAATHFAAQSVRSRAPLSSSPSRPIATTARRDHPAAPCQSAALRSTGAPNHLLQ